MSSPLISIIIPNCNRENLIPETLQSFIDQDYSDWECIIVDDGSTDNSVEVIQKFTEKDSRFKLIIRPENKPKGANTCRNIGFEAARGEFINWFDSDDVANPNFLSERIKVFETNPNLDLVICSSTLTDENLNPIENWDLKGDQENLYRDYILWKERILTPSVLFKKSFLVNKKLFNQSIVRAQEAELFYRILFNLSEDKFRIINKPLFLYRQHKDSKTHKNITYNSAFKRSESTVSLIGLENGFLLKDQAIVNYCYEFLKRRLHQGLTERDFSNVWFLIAKVGKVLLMNDLSLFFKFFFKDFLFWTFKYYIRKAIK